MFVETEREITPRKNYLKRDLTPVKQSPPKIEYYTVIQESNHEFVESPKLPIFKSISDKPSLDSRKNPGMIISEFPSPNRMIVAEQKGHHTSDLGSNSKFVMNPTLFESQPSGGDYVRGKGGYEGSSNRKNFFNIDNDSFAKQIQIRDIWVPPAPPLDGGFSSTKYVEAWRYYAKRENVFKLTLERTEDSWNSPHFALVNNKDSNLESSAGKSNNIPVLRKILLPIPCDNAHTLEMGRTGESVFILGEKGLASYNIFSHKMLQNNPSKRT